MRRMKLLALRFLLAGSLLVPAALAACRPPVSLETPAPAPSRMPGATTAPARTAPPVYTPVPTLQPAPTQTIAPREAAATPSPSSGELYEDEAGDIDIPFLDVTAFQVFVDEQTETVAAVLTLRDIPPSAEMGQVMNVVEYRWGVDVYLSPLAEAGEESVPDYSLNVFSFTLDASLGEEPTGPVPGTPVSVPFDQLFISSAINDPGGESIGEVEVLADPQTDTLTLRGRVPGVSRDSRFGFVTSFYTGAEDRSAGLATAGVSVSLVPGRRETTAAPGSPALDGDLLVPAGNVRAYPGPAHFAGDLLTFEVLHGGIVAETVVKATLTLDDREPFEVAGRWRFDRLVLPLALDTGGLSGEHTLRIQAQGSRPLDETYHFTVRPAAERPPQEAGAAWQTRRIPCCTLHYLSGTAAARDIDALAQSFQQAAVDFAAFTGATLADPLQVYLIDRMWGNGAFGGDGELVAAYTDRDYGPSNGLEGIETLARHEFTHAAGLDGNEDGFFLYNEGLAVYTAGGHYKPEPLPERGAAMQELGYTIKLGEIFSQHEIQYLYGAVLVSYIAETYGLPLLWEFVAAARGERAHSPAGLEETLRATFGVSRREFEAGLDSWLQAKTPGEQVDDLRLTVDLQDLRRKYQQLYAPEPAFIFGKAAETLSQPELLPAAIREPDAPANVALELLIARAQRAILAGEYRQAEALVEAIREVLASGELSHPLAGETLAIVRMLAAHGFEILALDLNGDLGVAQVTRAEPALEEISLVKVAGVWQPDPPFRP